MMRSTCTRWVHIAITCLSGFLLGYDLCVIGSVLTPVQRDLRLCFPCADTSDAALAHCTCAAKELVVSSVSLGAIAGGLLGGFLADRLGRRAALALTDVLFVVGAVGLAAAEPSLVSLFFIGRVLCGLALGAAGAVASVYLAEISPPHERGLVITLNEVAVCVGCLSAYLSSLALADSRWRWTVGIACAPALLQLAGVGLLFEESPRWLVERGLLQQGGNAAARLGIGISPLLQLQTHSSGETTEGRSWATELRLKLRAHRTPLALAAGCAMAHAASATNTVLYYSRDILQAAGVTAPLAANVGV
jgi:MFS family permease